MKKIRGTPRKFTTAEDFERKSTEYIQYCKENEEFPNIAGFCVFCDMHRDTFYEQKNIYPDTFKKVEAILEQGVINSHSASDTMKIFYLKNKHGYYDRVQQDVKVSGTIEEIFSEKQIDF